MNGPGNIVALFLAGGKGTRLWPLSTPEKPKPFISIDNQTAILAPAIKSVQPLIHLTETFIVLERDYVNLLFDTMPEFPKNNVIVEPVARNTAAAAGLATLKIGHRLGMDTVCLVLAVDHVITNLHSRFLETLSVAAEVAFNSDSLVDIGVIPTRPDTKYGYLHVGEKVALTKNEYLRVFDNARFTEKPNEKLAQEYLKSGEYLWNTAIFAWKCSTFLKAVGESMPDLSAGLTEIEKHLDSPQEHTIVEEFYRSFDNRISLDYGVMERASHIKAVAGNFGWTEIGSWVSLETIAESDSEGNIVVGDHFGVDTSNCIVFSDQPQPIYTLGITDLIVVNANGVMLVCHKDQLSKLGELVELHSSRIIRDVGG